MLVSSTITPTDLTSSQVTELVTRTREMLRIAATDTTQDTLLTAYVHGATTYLEKMTGLSFTGATVTEVHDKLTEGQEITALRGPISSITAFGEGGSDDYVLRSDGWKVLRTLDTNRAGQTVTYSVTSTMPEAVKTGICQCAVGLYQSAGQEYRHTLRHFNRVYVV